MKKKNLNVGKKLRVSRHWKFSEKVSKHFDEHVNQSIPAYLEMQKYMASISQFFIRDNQIIYDLGCSTGQTIEKILENTPKEIKFKIIGVDNQNQMLKLAKKRFKIIDLKKKVKFVNKDISKIKLKKTNLVIGCLLFNFLLKSQQDKLLKEIFRKLNRGGALILVDKVFSNHAQQQTIFDQLYSDFKLKKKLSPSAIINKQISLRSSMNLFKTDDNFKNLKKIGFSKVDIFYKWFNFVGTIAIK
jgi:tRNA (cmo5U34)-methyltransferase